MKYGIYFAYWEKEWEADYRYYIEKVAHLGFDILEIGCAPLNQYSNSKLKEIRDIADSYGIRLTAGFGPPPSCDLSSSDELIVKNAKSFYTELFPRLQNLGIDSIGGGLNSYWAFHIFDNKMKMPADLNLDTMESLPVCDLHNLREAMYAFVGLLTLNPDDQEAMEDRKSVV